MEAAKGVLQILKHWMYFEATKEQGDFAAACQLLRPVANSKSASL